MRHSRPRRWALACALVTLVAHPLLVAAPAAATQSWSVPRSAWITVKGHGYGHGHGMSQYGAEGAARQGLGFRQIAEFYYPGTSWGETRGWMHVVISADTTDDLVVLARNGLRMRDTGTGVTTRLPDNGATRWRIARNRAGVERVWYRTDRWRAWRTLEGEGGFWAGRKPVTLVTPSGNRPYRGRLWSAAPSPGSAARNTVNALPLENYLKGVVPLEMPASWSPAAVQAQAVAARTYAAYERDHRSGPICDTTSCQVYGGYAAEHPASNAAIDATRRLTLMYDGEAAFTQFGSSSGGWTSVGSRPYLTAKRDPYDGWAGNPVHDWSVRFTDRRFESAFPAIGNLTRVRVNRRDGNGEWGGRVQSLTLVGSRANRTISGDTLRSVLGLRSTWVTFVVKPRG
ncbi:MAG: SpoIID/LytB domain-containing protein [Nocardioides sp.]